MQGQSWVTGASMNEQPLQAPQDPLADPHAQQWEKTYATLMHLTLLAMHLFPVPVVPALVMWLVKRHDSPFINDHGKEAVNFQITLVIYVVAGLVLTMSGVGSCIGAPLIAAAYILGLVGMILASMKANQGLFYRYPMCLRFVH